MASRVSLLLVILASFSPLAVAQEDAADLRMTLMQATIADFGVSSAEIRDEAALRFAAKPILRYSDPTRGFMDAHTLLDATVWRLGESGRPTALVTLEIYRAPDEATLSYEFASLTTARFVLTLKSHADIYWNATGTDLKLRPLEGAPPPATTAAGRLVQMRSLARRFSVRETIADEIIECRLLTQPIDRYQAADDGIVDGVIFAFANGTNPELGLVIETDGKAWTYGVLRLSSAATSLLLGEREVASFPFYGNYGRPEGAYTSNRRKIELPAAKP